jgi:hypothetical protein
MTGEEYNGATTLHLSEVVAHFPVALLQRINNYHERG